MAKIEDGWFHCGFCIGTTSEDVIEINACERVDEGLLNEKYIDPDRRKIKPEVWDSVNEDIGNLERNYLKVLKKYTGIIFREEGHNGNSEIVGSCWFNLREHPEALDFIMSNANDLHQEPGTEPHDLDLEGCENVSDEVYKDTSEVTQHAVDVSFSFFDIEKDDYEEYETTKNTMEMIRELQNPIKESKIGTVRIGSVDKKVLDWLQQKAELNNSNSGGFIVYTGAGSDCNYIEGAPLLILQLSDMACESGYEYLWIKKT